MSEVLYRKYRPQKFSELINQKVVKRILQNAVREDRLSHAYLFTGPRGVGKTTMARLLAKTVNCTDVKDAEPCTKCENCQQIQGGRFLDLIEIDAASYTGVDNIRDVIDHTRFAPNHGKYKVFIIDEVHMLSKAAFNALLKTLEEPPEHALFVLATTEIQKVPATIISRTQRFDFVSANQADLLELVERVIKNEEVQVPEEARRLIAQAAQGSLRDVLSLLDQVMSIATKDKEITLDEVEEMLGFVRSAAYQEFYEYLRTSKTKEAVEFVHKLSGEGKDLIQFVRGMLDYLRLVLLVKIKAIDIEETGYTQDEAETILQQSQGTQGQALSLFIKNMMEAYRQMSRVHEPELPLLTAILDSAVKTDNKAEIKENVENTKKEKPSEQQSPQQDINDNKESDQNTKAKTLDQGQIMEQWGEVLAKVKDYNHSLISSLRLGRIVEVAGGSLTLAFPYSFHKDTIEARKNKIVLEQVLEDVLGNRLEIKAVLEKEVDDSASSQSEINKETQDDLVNKAMEVLGTKD